MDMDTLVRFGLPVVVIVGNNNGWGLEKYHQQAWFGYHMAAELGPGTRYDEVVRALGGHGELVSESADIGPAIDRAFAAGVPALVDVLTDPEDVYQPDGARITRIVDAWMQHPSPGFLAHPIFNSLRRWSRGALGEGDPPPEWTLGCMDAAGVGVGMLCAWWGPRGR